MDELEQKREQNRWKPKEKEVKKEKPKSSLPGGTIILMMATAGAIDGIQAVLIAFAIGVVANSFITVFMIFSFYVWFAMHDVSFMTPKRFGAMFAGSGVELVPMLNGIPTWTATVGYIILTTRTLEVVDNLPGGQVVGTVARVALAQGSPKKVTETAKEGVTAVKEGSKAVENTKKVLYMPDPTSTTGLNKKIQNQSTTKKTA